MSATSNSPRDVALAILRYFPHGGLQRIAHDTAQALARRGHRVTLFVHDWQGPAPGSDVDGGIGNGTFDVEVLPVHGHSNHARAVSFGRTLQARLGDRAKGLVLGFDRLPGLDLYFCADPCYSARVRRMRGPLHRWTPRARAFLGLERNVFGPESSTRVLLMNGPEQSVIQAEYGTPDRRFTVLPPGYSASRQQDARASELRTATRAHLGLDDRETPPLVLLSLGSDFHRKGFDRAVRALHALRIARPKQRAVLLVAGSGDPERDRPSRRLRRLAESLGVGEEFRCLGPRDDVPALLQAADLLVHPCRSEPAGMVILEALSAGTPVITSACAGYAQYVEDSGAGGVVAEPFELSELNRVLLELTDAPLAPLRDRALAYMATLDPDAMIDAVVGEVERA